MSFFRFVPPDLFLLFVFRFVNSSMWAVYVGLTEQPLHGAQALAVERIVYHNRYRQKGLDYDIALMKLAKPLEVNGISILQHLIRCNFFP